MMPRGQALGGSDGTTLARHPFAKNWRRSSSLDTPTAQRKIGAASTHTSARITRPATKCGATMRTS